MMSIPRRPETYADFVLGEVVVHLRPQVRENLFDGFARFLEAAGELLGRVGENAFGQELQARVGLSVVAYDDRFVGLEALLGCGQDRGLAVAARADQKELTAVFDRTDDGRKLILAVDELSGGELPAELKRITLGPGHGDRIPLTSIFRQRKSCSTVLRSCR